MNRIVRACSAAAILVALPSVAHAYVVQTTSGGKEIHWYYMPETFLIDSHGYSGITDGTLLDAEKASFTVWEDVPMCDARYDVKTSSKGVSDIFNDSNKPGRDRQNEMAFVEADWSGR